MKKKNIKIIIGARRRFVSSKKILTYSLKTYHAFGKQKRNWNKCDGDIYAPT